MITDYDKTLDLSNYKTYNIKKDESKKNSNDIDKRRFVKIIKSYLDSVGFKNVKAPDFLVNYNSLTIKPPSNKQVGMGLSNGQAGLAISTDVIFGKPKDRERLEIIFIDSKTNKTFWKGILERKIKPKITPEERVIFLKELIGDILKEFPPK